MYTIDLQTILRILSHQSGELRANVKQIAGIKRMCRASVFFHADRGVTACFIYYNEQPVLSGENAFQALLDKGVLEWEYIPTAPSSNSGSLTQLPSRDSGSLTQRPSYPSLEQSPAYWQPQQRSPGGPFSQERPVGPSSEGLDWDNLMPSFIPVQTQIVPKEDLANWPRPYRLVYQLSNGEKNIAEIAQLVSLSPAQIRTVLMFLVQKGIIILRNNWK